MEISTHNPINFGDKPWDLPIPDNPRVLIQFLTALGNASPQTNDEKAVHDAKHAEVRKRYHILQNGPETPPGQCTEAVRVMIDRPHSHGAVQRKARFDHLQGLLDNPTRLAISFPKVGADQRLTASPKNRLLANEGVQMEICTLRGLKVQSEIFKIRHFALANPTMHADELRLQIAQCQDLEQLPSLKRELSDVTGPDGRLGFNNVAVALHQYGVPVQQQFDRILALIQRLLTEWTQDMQKLETIFLANFGLPWAKTPASERYIAALAEAKLAGSSEGLLLWLGIPSV